MGTGTDPEKKKSSFVCALVSFKSTGEQNASQK